MYKAASAFTAPHDHLRQEAFKMVKNFEKHLKGANLAANTVSSYLYSIRQFRAKYDAISRRTLCDYKIFLIENYKPQTVNLRIRAVNCYLESVGKQSLKIPSVKIQQQAFLENVISEADYNYFKNCLKQDGEMFWYFVIRFLAATGARVSELIQFKAEHIKAGYIDLYSKGGKLRRIYIPIALQGEATKWLDAEQRHSGFIFLNKSGNRITARGISSQLKKYAARYNINPTVVYPHSFRHRFAKSFIERYGDIAFLADLMGHENIETTRIYLRKTSTEQQTIVNQIIDW
jgi:site-specific recombinase XerD